MHAYRVETTDLREGVLNIEGLPLRPGEKVEVIIKSPLSFAESTDLLQQTFWQCSLVTTNDNIYRND